jgi:hypothetical protein
MEAYESIDMIFAMEKETQDWFHRADIRPIIII